MFYLVVTIVVFISVLQLVVTPLPNLFVPRCWFLITHGVLTVILALVYAAIVVFGVRGGMSGFTMLHYAVVIFSTVLLIIWGFILEAGDPVDIPRLCESGADHAVYKFDNSLNARWSLLLQAWHVAHLVWALAGTVTGFAVFMAPLA